MLKDSNPPEKVKRTPVVSHTFVRESVEDPRMLIVPDPFGAGKKITSGWTSSPERVMTPEPETG